MINSVSELNFFAFITLKEKTRKKNTNYYRYKYEQYVFNFFLLIPVKINVPFKNKKINKQKTLWQNYFDT